MIQAFGSAAVMAIGELLFSLSFIRRSQTDASLIYAGAGTVRPSSFEINRPALSSC